MKLSELFHLIHSKCGIVSIDSPSIEENNILEAITLEADEEIYEVLFWSFGQAVRRVLLCKDEDGQTTGGIEIGKEDIFVPNQPFSTVMATCEVLTWFYSGYRNKDGENVRAILVIADIHKIASDTPMDMPVNRRIKDIALAIERSANRKRIIMIGQGISLAPSLSGLIEEIRTELPEVEEITSYLDTLINFAREMYKKFQCSLSEEEHNALIRSLQGMTIQEIARNFRLGMRIHEAVIDNNFIDFMQKRKVEKFKKLGVEFSPAPDVAIAGLDLWQDWVKNNSKFFGEDAKRLGIAPPKGAVLVGVSGTGKSLAAKSIAAQWKIPVLSLNIGSALSSYVGESEQRFRQILQMAESVAPCVLFIDELEKAFAGVGSGALDSGVMDRMFGYFLSWLNDKRSPVFVIAAANRIQNLPTEFLRRGRFDEVFFVDLPNLSERRAILEAHCATRKVEVDALIINEISSRTDGFNGAEIASLVSEAQKLAYLRSIEEGIEDIDALTLTMPDFFRPLEDIKPISQTKSSDIADIQKWGRANARPASSSTLNTNTKTSSRRNNKGNSVSGMDL